MTPAKESSPLVRIEFGHEPVESRIKHFRDFTIPLDEPNVARQTLRCLHCGTPYCSAYCPLHNRAVDFNLMVRQGQWRDAWNCLNATSSFPEFTSRVCPAICEEACTRYLLEGQGVGIKTIERAIVDWAWEHGLVRPEIPLSREGKRVAVVGSGPSGLACAQQLARVGHQVTVYEKSPRAGGLLRYGIPDFKMGKDLIDRRLEQMRAEGVRFELATAVGVRSFEKGINCAAREFIPAERLLADYDAVVLACGSETPRDLPVPGRDGAGVYFALELLQEQNRVDSGEKKKSLISCRGHDVVIIGGGDTGSDCIGTARRQGAGKIWQLDLTPMPPRDPDWRPGWPDWQRKLRTSSSQEEGCERLWCSSTKEIMRDGDGQVHGIHCVQLEWARDPASGRFQPREIAGSDFEIAAQRVLLAMGFTRPSASLLQAFGVAADQRGNARADPVGGASPFATSVPGVFACGDTRSGQSLVVRAMYEGRCCAAAVDASLRGGRSELPLR